MVLSDNRVDGWLLTDSYIHTVLLSMVYVVMTIVGPYVMKDRPPVNIRVTMLVYNFVMVIFSYYIFHEVSCYENILFLIKLLFYIVLLWDD